MPHHLLRLLIAHADNDAPAGGSCRLLRISRQCLEDRSLHAEVRAQADRLASLAVIWSDSTASVVTVLHHRPGRAGRRYRAID